MKRELNLLLGIFVLVFLSSFVLAGCNLGVSLLNQDPYPAVPGDYVKLVFQVEGVENSECQNVVFELIPQYPISFDPGVESKVTIKGGTFTKDFTSFLMVPFKVRVDSDALNGDTPFEVSYSDGLISPTKKLKDFNLYVEDVRVDFELNIKDYDYSTNTLTLEILNIGENDVGAVTIEIPEQENIEVKGSNKNIVGALDSNDYTTADFEAILKEEGQVNLIVYYTDEIGTRRAKDESVYFNPASFQDRKADQNGVSTSTYIITILILVGIGYFIYKFACLKKTSLL